MLKERQRENNGELIAQHEKSIFYFMTAVLNVYNSRKSIIVVVWKIVSYSCLVSVNTTLDTYNYCGINARLYFRNYSWATRAKAEQ